MAGDNRHLLLSCCCWQFVIERVVLRSLVNQEHIILFMATIGITYFLDGFGQTLWGSEVKILDLGIPNSPGFYFDGRILINDFDLVAALIAGILVISLALFFQYTRIGAPCARWQMIIRLH